MRSVQSFLATGLRGSMPATVVVNLGVAQNRTQRLPNLGSISSPEPSSTILRLAMRTAEYLT